MPLFLTEAEQLNRHLQSLARPPMQRSTSCYPLALRTRCWAPPCPRIQWAHPETPDGAMCWRNERPAETHSTGEALTVILTMTMTMSRSSPPRDGGTRTGHGEGDTPSICIVIWTATLRWSCSRNENKPHPRALLQRADSPSTRHIDHNRQMKPGNDHIQKHTSGKPSLKRRPSIVELF